MRTDKKIVDAQLSAIEAMRTEFLKFAQDSGPASPSNLKARHERIKTALEKCEGHMDVYWVAWLFGELEQRAFEELRKVVLLAQTTEPNELKNKYFPDLNQQLVDNLKQVKEYLEKNGVSRLGVKKIKKNKQERENEVIYRARYFLDNPEPKYKNKIENYRSSTLAKVIAEKWNRPAKISGFPGQALWANNVLFDVPDRDKVAEYIKNGVKRGELPEFVASPLKPRWKD